ncbi:hypothetical protein A6A04_09125 [Paramagnetospirillum marisnigri]|uniref:Response regulatory domain-containing protein n=1 Tax=Paramagnetospirillum marisnigri TaxID=1285242 RepID=A0A178M5K5_9PROT|nr:response regulator [Paramagnetospirillum marisnigri]OAN44031.1 hypothetical protein A6A04_09125 [Paramagnetospirillum marisnigri]
MTNPRILLVEDSRDDAELVRLADQSLHLHSELVVAEDGEAALDYLFRAEADPPAVVILDLRLPGMGGLEVLRTMRSRPQTRRIPVVILTGSERDEDVLAGYDLGANSFVRKPHEFEAFRALITHLEHYWVMTNLRPPV